MKFDKNIFDKIFGDENKLFLYLIYKMAFFHTV